jgi:DNA-binding NtrC family response regulator
MMTAHGSVGPPPATLAEVERDLIERALVQHRGNVTLAARELGVSRDTLRYRLDKYALKRGDYAG